MSAGKAARFAASVIRLFATGIIGWLLIAPLAHLVPRRRELLVVIGMQGGRFIDNAKYFFLQAATSRERPARVVFVTERAGVHAALQWAGLDAVRYPSWPAIWGLLRCRVAVVDSGDWLFRMRRFLLGGAEIVQLWHGVGFKRIGLDKMRHEPRAWLSTPLLMKLRMLNGALNGKLVRYAAVVAPSTFYDREVFRIAIPGRYHLVAGYPRNTFGDLGPALRNVVWSNVDAAVTRALPGWQAQGRKMVLVVPTFRDSRATNLGLDDATLQRLDDWCETQRVELVFKFHPFEKGASSVRGRHLHLCDPASDLYPLLPSADALVTDYSSIYMDFLLLDRPVLFLVPDLEEYAHRDRGFQFDFDAMTPGPKLQTWEALLAALEEQWRADGFKAERARLRALAFDGLDQREAVPTLLAFMRKQGWISAAR